MKIYKMLLFMAGVLLGLAAISLTFPSDGVQIGSATVTFPSLSEILDTETETITEAEEADTVKTLSPEEILKMREQALSNDKEYVKYMKSNPARIYMPKDNYLDLFFMALDSARNEAVRVMHYGDSQIEMDRISSYLREQFQTQFGGCGVGLMPAVQTVATPTITQSISPDLRQFMAYGGAGTSKRKGGDYGPMARCAEFNGNVRFTCRKSIYKNDCPHAGEFSTVTVLAKGSVTATCSTSDTTITMKNKAAEGSTLRVLTANIGKKVEKATVQISGNGLIYGVSIGDEKGVTVDNIPMRGCSGTVFTNVSEEEMKAFYSFFRVPLIILQYGGNAVPYLSSDKGISVFKEQIRKQIEYFKRVAPKSRILFIGPSDMSKKRAGEYHTYERLPQIVDSLRCVAIESGIAFWSLYDAMGGKDSMVEWVNSGLAGNDYLHFSNKGAGKAAKLLYDNLMFIRNHRKKAEKKVAAETDSLNAIAER